MERVLIIGDTGGIGGAVARKLRSQGTDVVGLSRSANGLDVTSDASVSCVLGAQRGPFDLIFVATGALEVDGVAPEKSLRALDAENMKKHFALNALGPALVIRHAVALLPRDGRSVLAVLSARVGSIGDNTLGGWISYRAAKAAVNQIVRTSAIEISRRRKHAICVALHPGTVKTALTEKYAARHPAVSTAEAAANLLSVIDGLSAQDNGGFFDWAGKPVPW